VDGRNDRRIIFGTDDVRFGGLARGRKLVVLVGTRKAVAMAVKRVASSRCSEFWLAGRTR
jgi:hypothetical protein